MPFPPEITQRLRSTPEQMAAAWVGGSPPKGEPVVLVPYDPCWPRIFDEQAAAIRRALAGRMITIEHVGSTAVPGLAAKPIIDIDLIVADSADEPAYVPHLERAGFRLVLREPSWHQHRMLTRIAPAVNLHVFSPNAPEHIRHLIFRDWLRTHPADRNLYETAKRDLAAKTVATPADYNLAKNPIIDEIYDRAFDHAAHNEPTQRGPSPA
ncbi:GrpB family protein [Nocardia violaceofusca]|uniref:GrpB family protein n=1 Tax=Nocardia violaceofusca TaxID=941182 RepID=UPI000B181381|nr:GrpB family protein [Nocardia violaceofusca]